MSASNLQALLSECKQGETPGFCCFFTVYYKVLKKYGFTYLLIYKFQQQMQEKLRIRNNVENNSVYRKWRIGNNIVINT